MSQMQDSMKKSEIDELDDSDDRQMEKRLLEAGFSWDEMMFVKLERALDELAKRKGWVRRTPSC
jgi:hypothetical protein